MNVVQVTKVVWENWSVIWDWSMQHSRTDVIPQSVEQILMWGEIRKKFPATDLL